MVSLWLNFNSETECTFQISNISLIAVSIPFYAHIKILLLPYPNYFMGGCLRATSSTIVFQIQFKTKCSLGNISFALTVFFILIIS